jgi:hypothetical protein
LQQFGLTRQTGVMDSLVGRRHGAAAPRAGARPREADAT